LNGQAGERYYSPALSVGEHLYVKMQNITQTSSSRHLVVSFSGRQLSDNSLELRYSGEGVQ
jgi:hypothetical protein